MQQQQLFVNEGFNIELIELFFITIFLSK